MIEIAKKISNCNIRERHFAPLGRVFVLAVSIVSLRSLSLAAQRSHSAASHLVQILFFHVNSPQFLAQNSLFHIFNLACFRAGSHHNVKLIADYQAQKITFEVACMQLSTYRRMIFESF